MNNNPNQWYENYKSSYNKQMLEQEAKNIRMLKEAGISTESWLVNIFKSLVKLFAAGCKWLIHRLGTDSTPVPNKRLLHRKER